MTEYSVVGKSVLRFDALEKVTGKAKYTTDIEVPGMLHGKVLTSPYPHAKIIKIDTSRAERLPGVKRVVTAQDAPSARIGGMLSDRYLLARDVVRFIGDPVAAVAAQTLDIVEEALDLIEVEYEELPAVFDVEEAMSTNPPAILHPELPTYGTRSLMQPAPPGAEGGEAQVQQGYTARLMYRPRPEPDRPNVHSHFRIRSGNVEKGFAEADLVLENRFSTARIQHCQFEPHICIAQPEYDGGLTLWASSQGMYAVKYLICDTFGLPSSRVRVIEPYVGGGYGGKIAPRVALYAALLALKSGKPVRVAFTREDVFVGATTRAPMVVYIKDGVKRDGTLVARELKLILDGGAYSEAIGLTVRNCSFGAVGSYKIPNFKLDSYGVYTNQPLGGAFRGLGSPEVLWAIESHMDMLAERLGIDPVEMRKKNLLKEGDINVTGEVTHSIGARECLDKVAEFIDWGKKPEGDSGPWKRGKGIALGNKYTSAPNSCSAFVKVYEDETIELRHSADEMGQGCNTVLAQIAAEEFRVPIESIKVVRGDSAFTPYDAASQSSKTTYTTGNAVRLACQDAKRQIFKMAAERLEAAPEDLETKEGKVYVKGTPEKAIRISQLFAGGRYLLQGGEILGKATFVQGYTPENPETGQGERLVSYYTHGAQAVEVTVNVDTGEVRVLKFGTAFDMGQPINPKLCEGQMEGGIATGIGSTLYEEMVIDNGNVVNPTFMDYKIPTIAEIPIGQNVKCMIAATPHRDGPYGAKGLGEAVMTPTAPAIASAVYNAVGIRIKDIPITREKVLKALKEAGKT